MPDIDDARPADQIVRVGRRLVEGGLVAAAQGNLSVRLAPDRFLITSAGARKGALAPEDLVEVGPDGDPAEGPRRPSSEWRLHAELYRLRPDAGAVCHAHPPCATSFTRTRRALPTQPLAEARRTLGEEVPLAPYAPPGSAAAAAVLRGRVECARALLLADHGAVSWGVDLEEAFVRMEVLERLARMVTHPTRPGDGG